MIWIAPAIERSGGRYTTSAGEEWRRIEYPNLIHSTSAACVAYVSSFGRVLSLQSQIVEGHRSQGYPYVSIATKTPEQVMIELKKVAVHILVARTFLGNPPQPGDTVDHIDRNRENNSVMNLRYADPTTQMENRERLLFRVRVDQDEGNSYSFETDSLTCFRDRGTARNLINTTPIGVSFTLQSYRVTVLAKSTKRLRLQATPAPVARKMKLQEDKAPEKILQGFLQGQTIDGLAVSNQLKDKTICNYLYTAARRGTRSTLHDLAKRLGLADPALRLYLFKQYRDIKTTWLEKEKPDGYEGLLNRYESLFQHYLPALKSDWIVANLCMNLLVTVLDHE